MYLIFSSNFSVNVIEYLTLFTFDIKFSLVFVFILMINIFYFSWTTDSVFVEEKVIKILTVYCVYFIRLCF